WKGFASDVVRTISTPRTSSTAKTSCNASAGRGIRKPTNHIDIEWRGAKKCAHSGAAPQNTVRLDHGVRCLRQRPMAFPSKPVHKTSRIADFSAEQVHLV